MGGTDRIRKKSPFHILWLKTFRMRPLSARSISADSTVPLLKHDFYVFDEAETRMDNAR